MIPLTPPQSLINVPDHVLRNESDRGFTRIYQAVNQVNQRVGIPADAETPTGAVGTNKVFTLEHTPDPPSSLKLFSGGLLQIQGNPQAPADYLLSLRVITFTVAPASAPIAWYRYQE